MPTRRCKATAKSGNRCKAAAVNSSDYCFAHEPTLAADRANWRREGGRQSNKKALLDEASSIQTPDQVKELLGRTVESLQRGDVDARTANAVGYLCNLLLKAMKETDLARRLDVLERAIAGEGD